jgi:hypothetical protein
MKQLKSFVAGKDLGSLCSGRIRHSRRNTMAFFHDMSAASAADPVTEVDEQSRSNARGAKPTQRRALVALAATLALSFGVTSQADAGDLKCEPDVFVKNNKATAIKVLRFEYTVLGKEEKVESLVNKRLAPGETEEWPTQKLKEAAEGNAIISTRVEFKNDNSGGGDGWGSPKWSLPHGHSESYKCFRGTNYWLGVN